MVDGEEGSVVEKFFTLRVQSSLALMNGPFQFFSVQTRCDFLCIYITASWEIVWLRRRMM